MSEDKTEVTVPKSELDAIIAQNAELIALVKSQNNGKGMDAANSINVKKERLVTIATVDGMPVVGMVNKGDEDAPWYSWTEMDPSKPNREILLCDLIVLDPATNKTEIITRINWLEFMDKGGRQDCPVKKRKGEQWEIENGAVTKRIVPEGDSYHMEELDMVVPDVVTGTIHNYVVDFKGTLVEVNENWVNMLK